MDIGSHDPAPDRTVLSLTMGFLASAAIGAVVRLDIADHIAQQPRTAAELADLTGVDATGLQRTLRFLAGSGIFYEDGGGRFHLTAAAERLLTGAPRSLRDAVVFLTEPMFWQAAGNFGASLQRGSSSLDEIFGVPLWEHLAAHPDVAAIFDAGMVSYSAPQDSAIADTFDGSEFRRIIDVGGGRGGLLSLLLSRNPRATGVLYDRAPVLGAHLLDTPELAGRWTIEAGDFFESVPADGDLYVLKHILHDWNDDECIRILRRCREAMSPGSRLLVAESIAPPPNTPHYVWSLDLMMLAALTGRERTRDEFEQLFDAADLTLVWMRTTASYSSMAIMEIAARDRSAASAEAGR
ncbi:SAM-dependent methyltransferase [Nocardia speluncae]|uniref:SAM-dependent methyltransferase n=1 Tax=Nocardia speluncae TaxID=419477 RepID=A0A846X9S1_9NOCA|nr:methyltransferase [Nocardia speluncae]NKY31779.1 SAM-dependent methyltransferase [Nocardia speluncae]